MVKKILTLITILLINLSTLSFSEDLPTLMDFLEPQFKCNSDHEINKNINEIHGLINTKIVSVISDFKYSDISTRSNQQKRYNIFYKARAIIVCGKKIDPRTKENDRSFVSDLTNKSGKLTFVLNEEETMKLDPDLYEEEGSFLIFSKEDKNRRPCLVKLEDLIKDISVINIDKLCEGKTEKEKKYTELQIKKMVSRWKNERGIK